MANFTILSLDGGGLRGMITAIFLRRLEEAVPGFLANTQLIAGTSTGGILALTLAAGLPPEAIIDLYQRKGPAIFQDSIWDDIRDLGKTVGADYDNRALKKALKELLGDRNLAQLDKKVAITAFDLDNEADNPRKRQWSPKVFHNFKGSDTDGKLLARQVALYTSAAPTYFPSVDGYIDGGVFANNPAMIGLAQALDNRNQEQLCDQLTDIRILSVGTGESLSYIKGQTLNWGFAQWVKPLINILMDGVSGIADFQCRQLLGERYHRKQVVFDPSETIPLDSVKKLPRMIQIGETTPLNETIEWLQTHWESPR